MSEEQAADIPQCPHDWGLPEPGDHIFICMLCGEEGRDMRDALECPSCGSEPKVEQQWVVRCGNYNSCTMRPRTTGADRQLAVSKWNCRSGKDANRWALYEKQTDTSTGEVQWDEKQ